MTFSENIYLDSRDCAEKFEKLKTVDLALIFFMTYIAIYVSFIPHYHFHQ